MSGSAHPSPYRFLPSKRPKQAARPAPQSAQRDGQNLQFSSAPRFSVGTTDVARHGFAGVPSRLGRNEAPLESERPYDAEQPATGDDYVGASGVELETGRTLESGHPLALIPPTKKRRLTPPAHLSRGEDNYRQLEEPPDCPEPMLFALQPPDRSASSSPDLKRPVQQAQPGSPPLSKPPKFKFSHAHPSTPTRLPTHPQRFTLQPTLQPHPPNFPTRPNFILPPAEDPQGLRGTSGASDEALISLLLSPRKKGQRFTAGGMANTVRDWVLDLAGSLPLSATIAHKRRSVATEAPVAVVSVTWSTREPRRGWILVCGQRLNHQADVSGPFNEDRSVQWILTGQFSAHRNYPSDRFAGPSRAELQPQDRIAVLHPTWKVMVNNEQWTVASRWQVIEFG